MADYSSEIDITWGSQGQQPPSGYSYAEGEQPVDEWDNFMQFQLVDDVVNHLIPLTNNRLESSGDGSYPSDPDPGQIVYQDQNAGVPPLQVWDPTQDAWVGLYTTDGEYFINGTLKLFGNSIQTHTLESGGRVIDPDGILEDADGVQRQMWVINAGDSIPNGADDDDIIFERE